jgi:hypothetical protein
MTKYEDAVEEGKEIVQCLNKDQWRLGELADGVATDYGEETLKSYAEDIGINFNTLRNYRSMYRKWPNRDTRPKSTAVAKALAAYPDREDIIKKYPDMTEAMALMAVKEFKKQKSTGKNGDLTLHALVAKACRMFDAVMSGDSELERVLGEIESYEELESEYAFKILEAMQKSRDRIGARMDEFTGHISRGDATRMMNRTIR